MLHRSWRSAGLLVSVLVVALAVLSACTLEAQAPPHKKAQDSQNLLGKPTEWVKVKPRPVELPTGERLGSTRAVSTKGPVVMNFWASWCGPCKDELPMLQRLARSGHATVVGVSRDTSASKAEGALRKARVRYPNWLDPRGSYLRSFGSMIPPGPPSSVLIEDGQVVAVHVGPFVSWADLNKPLRS